MWYKHLEYVEHNLLIKHAAILIAKDTPRAAKVCESLAMQKSAYAPYYKVILESVFDPGEPDVWHQQTARHKPQPVPPKKVVSPHDDEYNPLDAWMKRQAQAKADAAERSRLASASQLKSREAEEARRKEAELARANFQTKDAPTLIKALRHALETIPELLKEPGKYPGLEGNKDQYVQALKHLVQVLEKDVGNSPGSVSTPFYTPPVTSQQNIDRTVAKTLAMLRRKPGLRSDLNDQDRAEEIVKGIFGKIDKMKKYITNAFHDNDEVMKDDRLQRVLAITELLSREDDSDQGEIDAMILNTILKNEFKPDEIEAAEKILAYEKGDPNFTPGEGDDDGAPPPAAQQAVPAPKTEPEDDDAGMGVPDAKPEAKLAQGKRKAEKEAVQAVNQGKARALKAADTKKQKELFYQTMDEADHPGWRLLKQAIESEIIPKKGLNVEKLTKYFANFKQAQDMVWEKAEEIAQGSQWQSHHSDPDKFNKENWYRAIKILLKDEVLTKKREYAGVVAALQAMLKFDPGIQNLSKSNDFPESRRRQGGLLQENADQLRVLQILAGIRRA